MSREEDYLDGLLNSVAKEKQGDTNFKAEEGTMRSEDDFMNDFENDILTEDGSDDFLRKFERELAEEEADPMKKNTNDENMLFENLDGIVDSVKQEMNGKQQLDEDDIMVDTLGDLPGELPKGEDVTEKKSLESLVDEISAAGDATQDTTKEQPASGSEDDKDLMDLLQSDDDLSDIGDMLNAEENGESIDNAEYQNFAELPEQGGELGETDINGDEDGTKKGHKEGFLAKLSRILFGPDEEEEEQSAKAVVPAVMPDIEDLSQENLEILQQLDSQPAAPETPDKESEDAKDKKDKKKKEKKEKKPKKVNEKKPKKEKKPKPPKEPDHTPPLPKGPVVLIFIMAFSFLTLVLVATSLVSYTNGVTEAKNAYGLGNYRDAYQQVSGMKIKEKDVPDYDKYKLMATVSSEYDAYQSMMNAGIYDMALDSLIRTVGRCQKYEGEAAAYGCENELANLEGEAALALNQFGIDKDRAVELYGTQERSEYSRQVYEILTDAGLNEET